MKASVLMWCCVLSTKGNIQGGCLYVGCLYSQLYIVFFVMLAVDFGMLVNLHHCFYTGLLNLFYSFIKMRFEFFIYLR